MKGGGSGRPRWNASVVLIRTIVWYLQWRRRRQSIIPLISLVGRGIDVSGAPINQLDKERISRVKRIRWTAEERWLQWPPSFSPYPMWCKMPTGQFHSGKFVEQPATQMTSDGNISMVTYIYQCFLGNTFLATHQCCPRITFNVCLENKTQQFILSAKACSVRVSPKL